MRQYFLRVSSSSLYIVVVRCCRLSLSATLSVSSPVVIVVLLISCSHLSFVVAVSLYCLYIIVIRCRCSPSCRSCASSSVFCGSLRTSPFPFQHFFVVVVRVGRGPFSLTQSNSISMFTTCIQLNPIHRWVAIWRAPGIGVWRQRTRSVSSAYCRTPLPPP